MNLFNPPEVPRMTVTTSSSSGTVKIGPIRQRPHIMCFEGTAEEYVEKYGHCYLMDGPWAAAWPLPLHQLVWQAPPMVAWWSA